MRSFSSLFGLKISFYVCVCVLSLHRQVNRQIHFVHRQVQHKWSIQSQTSATGKFNTTTTNINHYLKNLDLVTGLPVSVYVCRAYTHTHTHTRTHTRTHTHTHTHTYTHTHTHTHTHTGKKWVVRLCENIYEQTLVRSFSSLFGLKISFYVCVCVSFCLFACLLTHY